MHECSNVLEKQTPYFSPDKTKQPHREIKISSKDRLAEINAKRKTSLLHSKNKLSNFSFLHKLSPYFKLPEIQTGEAVCYTKKQESSLEIIIIINKPSWPVTRRSQTLRVYVKSPFITRVVFLAKSERIFRAFDVTPAHKKTRGRPWNVLSVIHNLLPLPSKEIEGGWTLSGCVFCPERIFP